MAGIFLTKDLSLENKNEAWIAFRQYYKKLYRGWTREQLGFDPEKLDEWLEEQFTHNVGEFFIFIEEEALPFLTFSVTPSFINIYQMIGTNTEKDRLIRFLVSLYPERRFYGVIRKANKAVLDYYLSKGCKICENRFPHYDSEYYCGFEMNAETI